jgi:hypothetical protein
LKGGYAALQIWRIVIPNPNAANDFVRAYFGPHGDREPNDA